MDLLRSCYSVKMRLVEGGPLVDIDWCFADPSADEIGVPTAYCSANWELHEPFRFDSEIGEQAGPRLWRNGQRPAGLVGKQLCFARTDFGERGPAVVPVPRPVDESGVALCCQAMLSEGGQGYGGSIVTGDSPCTVDPCDCALIVTDMTPDVAFWAGQCPFLGDVMTLTKDGPCHWSGSWTTWGGTYAQRMFFAAGNWTWEIDTSPPCSFTVPGDTCLPLVLDFVLPDLPTQPFALGIPCPGDFTARFLNNG